MTYGKRPQAEAQDSQGKNHGGSLGQLVAILSAILECVSCDRQTTTNDVPGDAGHGGRRVGNDRRGIKFN
jgi:hypothetical protein